MSSKNWVISIIDLIGIYSSRFFSFFYFNLMQSIHSALRPTRLCVRERRMWSPRCYRADLAPVIANLLAQPPGVLAPGQSRPPDSGKQRLGKPGQVLQASVEVTTPQIQIVKAKFISAPA